jgi:Cu/Zn superoxide dismutase
MNKLLQFTLFSFIASIVLYSGTLKAGNGQLLFVAKLNTNNEVPPVRGDALGLVTFMLSEDRKEVLIHGVFTNLNGAATGCHIHEGSAQENGPVIINLTPFVKGTRIKAQIPVTPQLIQQALEGKLYLNVHTAIHPAGEIRGQLVLMSETIIPVIASSNQQVPPHSSDASAIGTLRISQNNSRLHYEIMPVQLSGPITAIHIHKGSPGNSGPVIAGLTAGDFSTGTITDTTLIKNIVSEISQGEAYINIHTDSFPDGEIRADLKMEGLITASAILNGDQEIPPVTSNASGYAFCQLNTGLDSISYVLFYKGLQPVSAHIHHGDVGIAGPVILPLQSVQSGLYLGKSVLIDEDVTSFLKDEFYFNLHTTDNPSGEIRGQIITNILNAFAFDLCGEQEVIVKNVPAHGAAYVGINKAKTELDYAIIADDLNGDAVTCFIYEGAFGSNGPSLLSLGLPNPFVDRYAPINESIANKIIADRGFINIHTAANPSGEIRGQIRRDLSCKINVATKHFENGSYQIYQNLQANQLILETDVQNKMDILIQISDVSARDIVQFKSTLFPGSQKQEFELHSIPSGFYTVSILNGKQLLGSFKLIRP